MNPQIVEKQAFTAVGMRIRTNPKSNEISELWTKQGQRLDEVPNAVPGGTYGIMDIVDMDAGIMDYMAAVGITEVGDMPDGMCQWDIPSATYAVFEATLPTLGNSFDTFYQEWLPNSDYERAAGPEFEHYGPTFNPHEPDSKLSVSIPVKNR
ncbi:MAG: GyrI-like domain-containing protein [Chloroflexota bacterium]